VRRMKSSLTTPGPCLSGIVLPRPQRIQQKAGRGFATQSCLMCREQPEEGLIGLVMRQGCAPGCRRARSRHPSSTFPLFLCNGTVAAAIADSALRTGVGGSGGSSVLRLLVIEDDPDLNRQLATALVDAGYVVDRAFDGEEGHFLGESEPYDAVILDIGLPKMDGISVLEAWRRAGRAMPVLILTARDRWSDKVQGFDAGADDYVAKPFHLEEVLARIRALLRRSAGHAKSELNCGSVRLDTRTGRVTVDGNPVKLTSHEYRLLSYLMHHTGRVVSRSELVEHLYDQDFDRDSNTIEVFVGRVRKKLGVDVIQTVRGLGYLLAPPGNAS